MSLQRMNNKQLVNKRDNLRKKQKEAIRELNKIACYLNDVEIELQNRKKEEQCIK